MARPRNLQARVYLLVILAFLPALGLYWYANGELRRLQVASFERDLIRSAELTAAEYGTLLKESEALLGALAEVPQIRGAEQPACNEILSRVLPRTPHYTTISVIGNDGYLVCGSLPVGSGLYLGDRSYYQRSVEGGRFAVGVYQLGRITGKPTVGIALPMNGVAGSVERVLAASIDLTNLGQGAAKVDLPQDATFTVLDQAGRVLVRRPSGFAAAGADTVGATRVEGFPGMPEGHEPFIVAGTDLDGFERVFAVAALWGERGRPEGYLAVGRHRAGMETEVDHIVTAQLRYLALAALVVLVLAWIWGHYGVARPAGES